MNNHERLVFRFTAIIPLLPILVQLDSVSSCELLLPTKECRAFSIIAHSQTEYFKLYLCMV